MATDENNEVVAVRTRLAHYELADRIMSALDQLEKDVDEAGPLLDPYQAQRINASRDYLLRKAQVHATLASSTYGPTTATRVPSVHPAMGADAL